MEEPVIGRYITRQATVGNGEPSFRGTNVLVADVLKQFDTEMADEDIIKYWGGALTDDMLREAYKLALDIWDYEKTMEEAEFERYLAHIDAKLDEIEKSLGVPWAKPRRKTNR